MPRPPLGVRLRDRLEPQRERPRADESRSQAVTQTVWLSPRSGSSSNRISVGTG
jgi:hypothetical protein